jgi:hypothetical protein
VRTRPRTGARHAPRSWGRELLAVYQGTHHWRARPGQMAGETTGKLTHAERDERAEAALVARMCKRAALAFPEI